MKFVIKTFSGSSPTLYFPELNLEKEKLTYHDWRYARSLEEAKEKVWFDSWYRRGINHREENGKVICELKHKVEEYVIEINSIEDLIHLINRSKYDIMIRNDGDYDFPEIYIEDDVIG
ncbi:MAG TPA: hypothetical protein PLK41_08840 [Defluviitoga tunisiensis]|nr:hypothetical protein [Defluviitoga tunisiensis]